MTEWFVRQVSQDRPATTQFKELSRENVSEKSLKNNKEPLKGSSGVSLFTV